MHRLKLSASIICANFMNLDAEVRDLRLKGFDYLHFDVMDGHFVPEVGLGLPVLEQLIGARQLPVDVHLMVTDPERYLDRLIDAGASLISIHQETEGDVRSLLEKIRAGGAAAGLALRPETALESVLPLLDTLDLVLLMAYAPGTRGQKPVPGFARRIGEMRDLLIRHGRDAIDIAVDGGVSQSLLGTYRDAGASFFILGTSGLFIPGTRLAEQIDLVMQALHDHRSRPLP